MKSLRFDINTDGDFYCESLFTTIVHEESLVLHDKMMENLREINRTFRTSKKYVERINECITKFLKAYDNSDVDSYFDKQYEDVWFVRNNNEFEFSFSLDNGNQQIYINEDIEVEVTIINGGYLIKEVG